jgi:hypothetical protein
MAEPPQMGVIGVEDSVPIIAHCTANNPFRLCHILHIQDAIVSEVVVGDVGDQGGITAIENQPSAKQSTSGGLEDGQIYLLVTQGESSRPWSGPVSFFHLSSVYHYTIRGRSGVSDSSITQDAHRHAGGGGFSIGACDEGERDALEFCPVYRCWRGQIPGGPGLTVASEPQRDLVIIPNKRDIMLECDVL